MIFNQPGPFENLVDQYEKIVLGLNGIQNRSLKIGPLRVPDPRDTVKNIARVRRSRKVVASKLADSDLDVIIGIGMMSPSFFSHTCKHQNIKLITCLHGIGNRSNDLFSIRARIAARILNSSDCVVGVSDACLERYRQFLKVPFRTIYSACEPFTIDRRLRKQFLDQHKFSTDSSIIGGLGRIQYDKGHHVLLEAFGKLAADNANLILCIGGSPLNQIEEDYADSLKELADQLGVADRCIFLGHVTPKQFFSIVDIFCHTYLGEEALSFAILESITANCPVIAVNRGGPREIISHNRSGQLIEPGNPSLLAEKINKYLSAPEFYSSVVKNAAELLVNRAKFDPKHWSDRWLDLISEICSTSQN